MDNENKCAHEQCHCPAANDSNYCSQHCEDADKGDITEIMCECGHAGCQ